MLGVAVVGILLLLALRPVRRVAVTLLVVGALASPFVSGAYARRAATLGKVVAPSGDFVKEPGFWGRASEALAALAMFRDAPWQGVGVGNYEHHYQSYARTIGLERRAEPREAHSLPLEIAAETGVPGLVLFGAFLVVLLRQSHRAWQASRREDTAHATLIVAATIALLGYLTTSLFLHDAYMRQFWIVAAVMHASAVSRSRLT
jgi:O-antigen ligase